MVVGFQFGGWDVADWLEEGLVVEPADPCEGGDFNVLEVAPKPTTIPA